MKKTVCLFGLLILVVLSGLVIACSKEDDDNSLVGTKWKANYSGINIILEFTSKTDACTYQLSGKNDPSENIYEGNYSLLGDHIVFENEKLYFLKSKNIAQFYTYYYQSAVFNNNSMVLTARECLWTIYFSDHSKEDTGTKEIVFTKVE